MLLVLDAHVRASPMDHGLNALVDDVVINECMRCLCAVQEGDTVDYIVTGAWSKKAMSE